MTDVHWLELGGLFMSGGEGQHGFFIEGIDGWDELPDARGSLDVIPGAHGSFAPVDVWRESRAITVRGSIHGADRADAERLRAQLLNGFPGIVTLRVSDKLGILSSDVRVDTVTPSDMGAWSSMIPFVIDMIAPDTVRYRDPVLLGPVGMPVREGGLRLPQRFPWNFGTVIPAILHVVNDGPLVAYPTVTVSGSASSVVVHGGARRLEFGAFTGDLVFDNLARRAWLNGVDVTTDVVRRDWQSVAAGESADFLLEATDAVSLTLSVEYRIGVW